METVIIDNRVTMNRNEISFDCKEKWISKQERKHQRLTIYSSIPLDYDIGYIISHLKMNLFHFSKLLTIK